MVKKKNKEFKIGEIVVYPKHGVGEIVKIEFEPVDNDNDDQPIFTMNSLIGLTV